MRKTKKESLSIIVVKTLLAVIIFTGLGTIIIGGGYIIVNYGKRCEQPVLNLDKKNVSIITDKTEYQTGEEVKLTVKNNLNEEIKIRIGLQNYKNNKWEDVSSDIFCFYSGRECELIKVLPRSEKELSWNQKVPWSNEDLEDGLYKFKIEWAKQDISYEEWPIFYSNEFTIKNDLAKIDTFGYCESDNDCYDEAFLSGCDCQFHCLNKNDKIAGCAKICDAEIENTEVPKCVCQNNKCVEVKFEKIDSKIIEEKDLTNDDWDWDSGQNCHGLISSEQCGYLDWPISYGRRIAGINNCYECLAEKNEDATVCESIEDEDRARKDNCYWRLVIALDKKGMNNKIDFCDKFSGEWKESYKEECLKLAN